ncbi:MAG TPA: T9SS type A sorting domain-containing protein, partial [Chitinophagales bacterium]|nr:T9SS type A sorting domain-containing protein [Chitinophagales bacterium]
RNCKFMGNQMGILAGDLSPSHILIENSEFANNGAGDGFSHNVYINHVDTLTFRYNYSHGAWVGHDLKSRAHVNFILYNRISDEQGEASRCIDLPNGGITYLVGNAIEQGPNSPNQDVIGYGLEGLSNPTPHELYAVNNTLVSNRSNAIYFHLAPPMTFFKAYNNILAGPASDPYSGLPTAIDTASNVFLSTTAAFHFADASNYNYQLTENSTLVLNNAMDPGFANGFSLSATLQYVHPTSMQPRCVPGTPDIGAFEWCEPGLGVEMSNPEFAFFPNPTSRFVYFKAPVRRLTIVNAAGNVEFERNNVSSLDLVNFQSGIYFLTTSNGTYPVMLFR